MLNSNGIIGVFDSGVGGVSVLKELIKKMPHENYIYVADSAYCPYGPKTPQEIIQRSESITEFLISRECKIIVVACNTATAAAIDSLREKYHTIDFVGMEPAVKPAAINSKSGIIGILATAGTFKGKLYNNTLNKYASNIEVIEKVGEGLVEIVENGKIEEESSKELLKTYIEPMIEKGVDHIVLGCTHYPFLREKIAHITGTDVVIVDPSPAVANRVYELLFKKGYLKTNSTSMGLIDFYSTGNYEVLKQISTNIFNSNQLKNFSNLNL